MARILVVEDDPQVRRMLRFTLMRAGHDVTEAADGAEGLRRCAEAAPDLVITDIIMPEVEGLETVKRLHDERPELPVIAISGGGQVAPQGYLDLARKLGAREAFTKPVDRDALLDAVRRLLTEARA
ncbi:MAG: response regulator [Candidatus Krumholzibacteriota bacterium]|nr:response regulator [Candidatus Krumholzibacteriota bacterium]